MTIALVTLSIELFGSAVIVASKLQLRFNHRIAERPPNVRFLRIAEVADNAGRKAPSNPEIVGSIHKLLRGQLIQSEMLG